MTDPVDPGQPAPAPSRDTKPAAARAPFPAPVIVRANRLRFSLVWIVPLVALLAGIVLVARTLLQAGPLITITFRNAEGLEPGRTEVRYKEVVVGRVNKVGLSPDRGRVLVTVRLDKSASSLAVADTGFWVVRPRIGTAGISGLGTLFSGVYIGADAGETGQEETHFTGLEVPPFVQRGEPGRSFVLNASDLGSLEVGSPVYYRRTRVGRVVGYSLDPKRDGVDVQVFVESPNEALVTQASRFWNASGIDMSVNAAGLTVNTESLAALVAGGIAFAAAPGAQKGQPAPLAQSGQRFVLYADRKSAMAPPDGPAQRVRMLFSPSMRGLAVGAPVELLGAEIGSVLSVAMQYDARTQRFPVEVVAEIFPARLGDARRDFMAPLGAAEQSDALFLRQLVERGMRAQLKSGNLLTGQPYVALDIVAKAPKATLDVSTPTPTIPSLPGGTGDLQPQVSEILERIARINFEQIGANLEDTLKNTSAATGTLQDTLRSAGSAAGALEQTLTSANLAVQQLAPQLQQVLSSANSAIEQLSPQAQEMLAEVQRSLKSVQATLDTLDRNLSRPDAPLQRNANQALAEIQRAARALRVLGDYLQLHPESLLRGKPADADVGPLAPQGRQ
ncbi:MAG: MlaD family protein [Burkholderiaceae bacterium]